MNFQRIAVGGSAADPPHLGHLALIKTLINCQLFDAVIWIPSGERPDKKISIEADHRVAMTELTFPTALRIRPGTTLIIKYNDIYQANTPTIEWLEQLQAQFPAAQITWYTGSDSVRPQKKYAGRYEIEAAWDRGAELVTKWNFLIIPRRGYALPASLPANFQVLNIGNGLPNISSSKIRQLIGEKKPFEHLVTAEVAEYIKRFDLYQGKTG